MLRGSEPCCSSEDARLAGLPRPLRGRRHPAETLSVRGLCLGFSPWDAGADVVCQGHSPGEG